PLVHKQADVALRFGLCEGALEDSKRFGSLAKSGERQRLQEENFQGAAQACFLLGIRSQARQQAQGLREKRPRWLLASLGDAHAGEGQVFPLAWVARLV